MSHIIIIYGLLISDIWLFNFLGGSTLLIKIRKINETLVYFIKFFILCKIVKKYKLRINANEFNFNYNLEYLLIISIKI